VAGAALNPLLLKANRVNQERLLDRIDLHPDEVGLNLLRAMAAVPR
jgi:hypothetical protein